MAGAGYKLFNTGDVLTAAQVNTYLQQQVTMVFANSTARTTALSGVLAEGMMSYLQDTNAVEVYDGSNWVSVGNTGDITGVTAGTGLTGGGTSGTVTLTNDMATTITAKGDLIVGTGNATYDNLAVGTNGYTLVADSSETTGLKWAAPAGGGKVLQVVNATYSTETTIASTTYTDTGLSVSITPSSATSKILILVQQSFYVRRNIEDSGGALRLLKDSTAIFDIGGASKYSTLYNYQSGATNNQLGSMIPIIYLDSPSTTSSLTYKTQARSYSTANSGSCAAQLDSANSSITVMEIGA